jgi:hypothetical protein
MPDTETHEDYYKDKPKFEAPRSYIRYKKLTQEEEEEFVYYDADEMDEAFVKAHINVNDAKRHQLNIERFEMLINAIENFEAMRQDRGLKMTSAKDAEKLFREKFKFMSGPNASKLSQDIVQYVHPLFIILTSSSTPTPKLQHEHQHTDTGFKNVIVSRNHFFESTGP